jgi:hypothetical protein
MVARSTVRWARTAVIVVTVLAASACSSDSEPRDATPTTTTTAPPSTTAPTSCGPFGGLDQSVGVARLVERSAALLSNVQIQASGCVDEVAFDFTGGTPSWTVAYVDPPFTLDPSDRPADVPGKAFLRVTLRPASGVDLTLPDAHQTYDGPTTMTPPAPSAVESVVQLGDFEAVSTWVIGLPEKRPFEVTLSEEQVVVRVASPAPRPTRCELAGSQLTVGLPAGWYAELSDRWTCQYLHPEPFIVHPATNDFRWLVTAQVADVGAAEVMARMRSGTDEDVASTATTVAGLPATRLDLTASGEGLLPARWGYRMYVVDTGARATTFMGAAAEPGPGIAANASALDSVVELVESR